MNEDGTLVRVTMTVDYYLPKGYEIYIDEWFKEFPLSRYHASREGLEIGGSKKLISVAVIEEKDM